MFQAEKRWSPPVFWRKGNPDAQNGQNIHSCTYRNVRPHSLPAESHSFVGVARESASGLRVLQASKNTMKHWLGDFAVDHTGHPAPLKKKQSVLVFDPRLVVPRNLLQ